MWELVLILFGLLWEFFYQWVLLGFVT